MPVYHVTHKSVEYTTYRVEAEDEDAAEEAALSGKGEVVSAWQGGDVDRVERV